MLHARNVLLRFWIEAINTSVYICNRIASRVINGITPLEKLCGEILDISSFRIFGCLAYAHVSKETRKKLDSKTRECLFLGYSNTGKAYRLWSYEKQQVITSRDVIFDKDGII